MYYNRNDQGDSKLLIITKHLFFWGSLAGMFALFILLFNDDVKIPQKEVTLKLDMSNKINICVAEDESLFKKGFFEFN